VTVAIGLVGLGYWGPNLARVIRTINGGSLAWLCDADPGRLEAISRQYPGVRTSTDVESLLSDRTLDAVVIATPADTHFQIAGDALRADKHVLVEKPLARTAAECTTLIAEASSRSRVLMPGHVFLYNAAVRKVREYITSGELGEVYYVYSQRLNLGQVRADVNALWNFAPHDISIIRSWLDASPQSVVARGFSYLQPGIDDVVFMTMDYPSGVGANVHISWLDPHKIRLMTVVGSEKMVVYDDTSPDARIRLYDKGVTRKLVEQRREEATLGRYETFGQFQLLLRAGDVLIPKIDFREPLQLELEDFIGAIEDGRRPISDAETGLDVVRCLEAAQRSMDAPGSPVSV
jgi:predicted dehydrogenase